MEKPDTGSGDDQFDLRRFINAQEKVYNGVLVELRSGHKRTHWMWYIFPQIVGLGYSTTSKFYAIRSIEEGYQYLNHPILGSRLRECAEAVLAVEGRSASEIFGYPDTHKLKSSMTLFACVEEDPCSVFFRVLDKYFQGKKDTRTLDILEKFKGVRKK